MTKQKTDHSGTIEPQPNEAARRETHCNLIGTQVLHALGKPADLLKVYARSLWGHYYRVNVVIGKDVSSATIVNSYFIETDDGGSIVKSTPAIKKTY